MSSQTKIFSSARDSHLAIPPTQKSGLLEGRAVTKAKNQPSKGWYALAIVIGILVIGMGFTNTLTLKSVYDFSWICPSILGGTALIAWASCKIDSIRLVEKKLLEKKKFNHQIVPNDKKTGIDDFPMDGELGDKEFLTEYNQTIKLHADSDSLSDREKILNNWFVPLSNFPDIKSYDLEPAIYHNNFNSMPQETYAIGTLGKWCPKPQGNDVFKKREESFTHFLIIKTKDGQLLKSKKEMTTGIVEGLISLLQWPMAE